jgi:hypothetical protein
MQTKIAPLIMGKLPSIVGAQAHALATAHPPGFRWRRNRLGYRSVEMVVAGAEQSYQPYEDQVQSNDVIQEARYDKDQYSGDKRDDRRETECHIH